MLIQLLILCVLRIGCTNIVDTYVENAKYCNELLQKAKDTQVESVRNAYCVEVVEADQKAVLNTLDAYSLSFLASNSTYGTFVEVLNYSCKVPSYVSVILEWTSGLLPLTVALLLYRIIEKGKDQIMKFRQRKKVHVQEEQGESKDDDAKDSKSQSRPQKIDRPPVYPSSSPSTRRDRQYIRKRKEPKKEQPPKPTLSANTEALVTNIPSTLRKRLLNVEEP